jgi:hypothetical protein
MGVKLVLAIIPNIAALYWTMEWFFTRMPSLVVVAVTHCSKPLRTEFTIKRFFSGMGTLMHLET